MNKWFFIVVCVLFISCKTEEIEPEVLISEIDGAEYVAEMKGEMTAKKATHLILQGKGDSIDYTYKRAISDSLHCEDSAWRIKYFEALNTIIPKLDSADLSYLGANTFSYFLHHPNELLTQFNTVAFDNSEIWLKTLSEEYTNRTTPEDITINSVINLAHKYCASCSDREKQSIIEFVEALSVYEE